jgi:UDP-N-acetyl-D-glucosamine dehydrogenase
VTEAVLTSVDASLIVTDHSEYDYEAIAKHSALVIDTRNACGGLTRWREKIVRA